MDVQTGKLKLYDSAADEYFYMEYDENGALVNEAEVNERFQRRYEKYESERRYLQDPQQYIYNPEEYRP